MGYVPGVTKSRTRLSDFHFFQNFYRWFLVGAALRPGVQLGNRWEDFWLSSQALGAVSAWWEALGCAWEDCTAERCPQHQAPEKGKASYS